LSCEREYVWRIMFGRRAGASVKLSSVEGY
jgi:hypothetical protein